MRHFLWLVFAILVLAAGVGVRPAAADTRSSARAAAPHASEPPVAVPEPTEKAVRYYRSGVGLWLFDIAWGLAVPLAFLFSGFSARLRDLARLAGRRWFFTIVVYFVLFAAASFVIDLPLTYYEEFVRPHAYGLSDQTLAKWTSDLGKGFVVGLVVSILFGWVPFLLLEKSPKRWWLYTGLLAIPFLCLMLWVAPVWIDPMFNHYGPMKDKALEAQVLDLAHRAGIEGGRVYEVDKSVDTKTLNAYVAGLGRTKRIVLWDTIIAALEPRELLAVMGHEMGHYVLGHIPRMIAVFSVLILATLWVAHRTADGLIARYRARWGFDRLSDVAALPLLLLLMNVFFLLVSPAFLAFVRHQEHEADRFGLEVTHDNHAMATAFVKLQEKDLMVPRPSALVVFFRSSHPSLGDRIDFANTYHPWADGAGR